MENGNNFLRFGILNLVLAWCWRGSINNLMLFQNGTPGFGPHAEWFIYLELIGLFVFFVSGILLFFNSSKGAWVSTFSLLYLMVQGWGGQLYNLTYCLMLSKNDIEMCWDVNSLFHYFTLKRLFFPIWNTRDWIANYFFISWFVAVQAYFFHKFGMYENESKGKVLIKN